MTDSGNCFAKTLFFFVYPTFLVFVLSYSRFVSIDVSRLIVGVFFRADPLWRLRASHTVVESTLGDRSRPGSMEVVLGLGWVVRPVAQILFLQDADSDSSLDRGRRWSVCKTTCFHIYTRYKIILCWRKGGLLVRRVFTARLSPLSWFGPLRRGLPLGSPNFPAKGIRFLKRSSVAFRGHSVFGWPLCFRSPGRGGRQ